MYCLKRIVFLSFLFVMFIIAGCKNEVKDGVLSRNEPQSGSPLFNLLQPETTNIIFNNTLTESPYANIITYPYFYNGGGVAMAILIKTD